MAALNAGRRRAAAAAAIPAGLVLAALLAVGACSDRVSAPLPALDGAPPADVVARCLDRAITMTSCLQTLPGPLQQWPANLDLIAELQPALIGRAALVWGWEPAMLQSLQELADRARQVHRRAPGAVLQGCIFEFITPDVGQVAVPAHVQEAFGLAPRARTYDHAAMLPVDRPPDHAPGWDHLGAVPDITRLETRLWFYHLATLYLDAGLEAIHLGNLGLVAAHDRGLRLTEDLLERIRDHAARRARRGWVLLDAHTHGLARDRRLLLDFHSWPLRPRAVGPAERRDAVIEAGHLDAIYGRSRGGITPDGRLVRSQRFLVEIDNGYAGAIPDVCTLPECVWGSDEITWFASLPAARRDDLLRYLWRRVPALDPAGRFQMPGVRPLQVLPGDPCTFYLVHDPALLACGAGQQDVVAELWGVPADDGRTVVAGGGNATRLPR